MPKEASSKKKYKCQICCKGFTQRKNLYRHARSYCKGPNNDPTYPVIPVSKSQEYTNLGPDESTLVTSHAEQSETPDILAISETQDTQTTPEISHVEQCEQQNDVEQCEQQNDVEQIEPKTSEISETSVTSTSASAVKNPPQVTNLVNIIKTQQEQINTLADIIKNKSADTVNSNNNTVINNNIVYVTDQLDYLEILDKKFGGEKRKTIEFIKSKLHGKLQGEIDMFSAIHLNGPPNTWPIKCPDKSKRQFYLVQPDNTLVPDPGGITTHKNFYRNLQTAVLKLINMELTKVIDQDVGSEKFEGLRDNLLDDFDLQTFQNRALEMCHQKPGPFVKHLIDEIAQKELLNTG